MKMDITADRPSTVRAAVGAQPRAVEWEVYMLPGNPEIREHLAAAAIVIRLAAERTYLPAAVAAAAGMAVVAVHSVVAAADPLIPILLM